MKVIFVDNPHDARSREARDRLWESLNPARMQATVAERSARGEAVPDVEAALMNSEFHVVDFSSLSGVLPVRAAPCVLLLFDELEETGATATAIKAAVGGALRDLRAR